MSRPMEAIPRVTGVEIEEIRLREPFQDLAARFAHLPESVVLLSGGEMDSARHHILAVNPWLTIRSSREEFTLTADNSQFTLNGDPFALLRRVLERNRLPNQGSVLLPVVSGLFGYFSYDLKNRLEELNTTCLDDLHLPELYLVCPSILVIQVIQTRQTYLCLPVRDSGGRGGLKESRDFFFSQREKPAKPEQERAGSGRLRSNYAKSDYILAIEKIRDYIKKGHVYQVNLSQRFSLDFKGSGYALFQELFARNPAPFFAYINAGDHEVLSTSPERFLQRLDRDVETRPIKGTRPRGGTPEEDRALRSELQNSPKDRAELSMIVDLHRNDLGKVCSADSVRVAEHLRLEAYKNVFHLVSIVKGELDRDKDSLDLISAAFPGGSITGCPKVRAMEIIDELETHKRHIYTGSIGYLSFHDTLDLSIAIRTATLINQRIVFSVGGGIVFDSEPEAEYSETLHKGQTLMQAFQGEAVEAEKPARVWFNGLIVDQSKARIPANDPGFQYGFGIFETIRVDQGKVRYLHEHIQRLSRSWTVFFDSAFPDLSFQEIIASLLQANELDHDIAAVKILAARGERTRPPWDHTLLITARKYTPRLKHADKASIELRTYPQSRQSPLADHKTCNYLYYFLAGQWARQAGANEALILNPDGTISETNTANLLIIRGKSVLVPTSCHVLPGITQEKAMEALSRLGFTVDRRKVFPTDLRPGDRVLLTNSLLGAAAVRRIDDREFRESSLLAKEVNRVLFPDPSMS
ncbi:MAG: aminodeoxychorismate synthase component I [Desulfohalobiaceae bacterium]|nr:aminodeoxychorismate synthase component I [Desulfohalobiaceae bacterium]